MSFKNLQTPISAYSSSKDFQEVRFIKDLIQECIKLSDKVDILERKINEIADCGANNIHDNELFRPKLSISNTSIEKIFFYIMNSGISDGYKMKVFIKGVSIFNSNETTSHVLFSEEDHPPIGYGGISKKIDMNLSMYYSVIILYRSIVTNKEYIYASNIFPQNKTLKSIGEDLETSMNTIIKSPISQNSYISIVQYLHKEDRKNTNDVESFIRKELSL